VPAVSDRWKALAQTAAAFRRWAAKTICLAANLVEHVFMKHARILNNRAIEPTTWIAKAVSII
jgi:hypothetical protein